MNPKPKSYRELVAALREKLNADDAPTIRQVSAACEIPVSRVSDFKNSKLGLSFERMDKLARYFKIQYNLVEY